jgi:tetratricopeptide (TPR) repeat protein
MKAIKLVILLVISQVAFAQIPTLSIHRESGNEQLEISQLDVNIEVVGNITTTTFDIVFYNPFDRILEGELSMPLKEEQEICRYALDINGKLREGVIVEKVKARQTFEAVVRRKIDPGIITKTKGNNFKTKIYPIPAKGSKRVVLALSEVLKGDDNSLYYSLPFGSAEQIKQFSLNAKVIKSRRESSNIRSEFHNVQFDHYDDAYVLNFEQENFSATEPLKFTIPHFSKDKYQFFTCDFEGETYFYLNIKPSKVKKTKKEVPRSIAIFWDNSYSASNRNIAKELNLLKLYLNSLSKNTKVSVVAFNYSTTEPKTFISKETNEIISYIKALENDGATCLDEISFTNNVDEILLFSDGINTIGMDKISTPKVSVFGIASSVGSNYSLLNQICTRTKGEFIDLTTITIERALQLLTTDEEKFLSCNYNSNNIKEVYPNLPTRVDNHFNIVGILIQDSAEITVNFGNKSDITQTKTYTISKNKSSPAVARVWATKKIADLDFKYERNKDEIFTLSQKHNIITKNTAMLVLDRVEDYVTHKITPPDELQDEYNKLIALQESRKPHKITAEEIEKRNISRIEELIKWFENPILSVTKQKRENIVETLSGQVSGLVIEEEAVPITRQEEVNPLSPPPPPNVADVLNIVEDDVVLDEEFDLEDAEFDEDTEVVYTLSKKNNFKNRSSIKVLSWIPDAPYIKELRGANDSELLPIYYKLKDKNGNRPSFYIQVADLFFSKGKQYEAVRILSNAVELDLENPELLKVVARRFLDEKEYDLAIKIFEEIKKMRPEEPQSYRDLAMAYNANKEYQKALEIYLYIIDNKWERFEEIKDVVLNELNHLIALHRNDLELSKVNKGYIKAMPLDVRITIDWSSNENDIDLWVIDPNGEKCFYSHPKTNIGGKITSDFTRGYGPEEFSLKSAKRGFYTVYVNYYSESRQTITGPVTVYAELTTHYGTKKQETERIAIQLENSNNKKTIQIGQLEFKE